MRRRQAQLTPLNNNQARLSRRSFLILTGGSSLAAILVACGQGGTATEEAATAMSNGTAPTTAAGAEAVTISFWTPGGSDTFCEGFNTIAKEFQAVEPGIIVSPAQCYSGDEAFREVLLASIAAGTPPDSTILWDSPVAYAVRGALEPLDALMDVSRYSQAANWPAGVLASCQHKGQTYGLPATAGSYGIFYNRDWFDSLGIPSGRDAFPKTWDELRALSKEFTQWNGDVLEKAGFIPWSNPGDVYSMAVELAVWSALNGTQLYDEANLKYTLDSAENIEMMQYALDWWAEEYKGDLTKVRASNNWGGYEDNEARPPSLQQGNLAMLTNGFWFTGDIYSSEMTFENWDTAPFPIGPSGSKSVSGYWPNWLVIPKGSPHAVEAFKYLDYIGGEGIKTWFANIPDVPANLTVPADLVPAVVVEKRG